MVFLRSFLVLLWVVFPCLNLSAFSRIKDIASFEGVRENVLLGYGLVVGLNGTGDDLGGSPYTKMSFTNMLERLGMKIAPSDLKTKSVAAVMITATLPPFARNGGKIDVTVSTIGNASSLAGGTLLVAPLRAADGEVYAVAQGSIAIGGFLAGGTTEKVTKGVPTSGKILNGATIEREIVYDFNKVTEFRIALNNPDFTTAKRVAQVINNRIMIPVAFPADSATIQIKVPPQYKGKMVAYMTEIEQLPVDPDQPAVVVIDEKSGIIVMGEKVSISRVAIAQGNLIVEVQDYQEAAMPGAFTQVQQATQLNRTKVRVDEGTNARVRILEPGINLNELVRGLNSLGVGPRDLITILQNIKAAGALQADIMVT